MLTNLTKLLPIGEAPYKLRTKFKAYSRQIYPPNFEIPPDDANLFMYGRTSGFTMGTYKGKAVTTICSWKEDENGNVRQTISCENSIRAVSGIHSEKSFYFGRDGDSGAAILDEYGMFVGLFFAGNDYTGSGYFTAAQDLFSNIKWMTSAEEVDLLPIL